MLMDSTLHYLGRFFSTVFLPLLLLASIALFCVSIFDLALIALTEKFALVRQYGEMTVIDFADPWHALIGSGALAFFLIVSSDFGNE